MVSPPSKKQKAIQGSRKKIVIFFHLDYTIGSRISLDQLTLADFTAGLEFHHALKLQKYYTFKCLKLQDVI